MTKATIDNSAGADIRRAITWQFDKAEHLVGIISMFADFFRASTEEMWDTVAGKINLENSGNDDAYQLALWGKLLGLRRPTLNFGTDQAPDRRTMSASLYRKILIGRLRLTNSSPTPDEYIGYVKYVFGNNVRVDLRKDMSIGFTFKKVGQLTDAETEQKLAIEQFPDIVFAYPAGVKSDSQSTSHVFSFAEQAGASVTRTVITLRVTNYSSSTVVVEKDSFGVVYEIDGAPNKKFLATDTVSIGSGKTVSVKVAASGRQTLKDGELEAYKAFQDGSGNVLSQVLGEETLYEFEYSDPSNQLRSYCKVGIYGSNGTQIPTGSRFTATGKSSTGTSVSVTMTISSAASIGPTGYCEAIFNTSSDVVIPGGTDRISIVNSSGQSISGITTARLLTRTSRDFTPGGLDEASFSWAR